MRAIDADALKELFREVIGSIAKRPEMSGNLEHMVRASAMVIEMIDDAPTIVPERKPGHWEMLSEQSARCTACGAIRYTNGRDQTLKGHIFYAMYKFCPMCGVQMEVEHE